MNEDREARFRGLRRLVGEEGAARLGEARVAVVGLGGVGSWVVEALARSGIGGLTLMDLDEVCLSNVNRQLPALTETVGRFKAEVLAERVRAISPDCEVRAEVEFFTEASAERFFSNRHDAVVDAIDAVRNKARLVAGCRARGIPVIVSGAAGGKLDPTRVRVIDLGSATHDRLLAEVRRRLRREYGISESKGVFGIPCVWSDEAVKRPVLPPDACGGGVGGLGGGQAPRRLNCETGYGSAAFVTGAFGLAAAAWVVERIVAGVEAGRTAV